MNAVLSPPRLFLDEQTGDQPSPSREELYMELKKADKLRLDDQRGTKLNCEIPEFLRNSGVSSLGAMEKDMDKENKLKSQPVRMDESDFSSMPSSSGYLHSR